MEAYDESSHAMVAALLLTTTLGGTAFAADQAAQQSDRQASPQVSASQKAIDTDVGRLSKDCAQGFRDLQLTRVAIFEADTVQAKDMIGKAQAAFAKAKTDNSVFTKAAADLKPRSDIIGKASVPSQKTDAKPPAKKPIA